MKIEIWLIERILPYPKNARVITQRAIDKVALSLKELQRDPRSDFNKHLASLIGRRVRVGAVGATLNEGKLVAICYQYMHCAILLPKSGRVMTVRNPNYIEELEVRDAAAGKPTEA